MQLSALRAAVLLLAAAVPLASARLVVNTTALPTPLAQVTALSASQKSSWPWVCLTTTFWLC